MKQNISWVYVCYQGKPFYSVGTRLAGAESNPDPNPGISPSTGGCCPADRAGDIAGSLSHQHGRDSSPCYGGDWGTSPRPAPGASTPSAAPNNRDKRASTMAALVFSSSPALKGQRPSAIARKEFN